MDGVEFKELFKAAVETLREKTITPLWKQTQPIRRNFADAKRYNQYWDELEKGVHIDHPGLTQADIDAWKLADIKLDEHIAISKVDTDAVVKLRANEATAYDSFITSKNSIDEISSSSLLDIDAIRPKLKTEPDTAFFWSGRTDGIGGRMQQISLKVEVELH